MQTTRKATQARTNTSACAPKMSRQEGAALIQKYQEKKAPYQANMIDYYLRKDEEMGYIEGCFDDASDELALLREFGL